MNIVRMCRILGVGVFFLAGLVACQDEPVPDATVEAETQAPKPTGQPVMTAYFSPDLADLPVARRRDATELTPEALAQADQLAALALTTPEKIVLISTFYDAKANPNNDADYARLRARVVHNHLAGAGVPEARIFHNPPTQTAPNVSVTEAFRVEVRIQ